MVLHLNTEYYMVPDNLAYQRFIWIVKYGEDGGEVTPPNVSNSPFFTDNYNHYDNNSYSSNSHHDD
jgi:hypothetical protein